MPRARKELIDLDQTPYYHLICRCVRRAFLCGEEPLTGRSYEHRKEWIEQRLRLLSSIFAINLCAYAVMSNHYHAVVCVDVDEAKSWNDKQVVQRWLMLFKGPRVCRRFIDDEPLDQEEVRQLAQFVEKYRERLSSISWFMRCMNEYIARQANREDKCTGSFWESRFCSQALNADKDVLACMTYVDLNPVRAGLAKTPESSPFTSVKERLRPNFDVEQAIRYQTTLGMPRYFDIPLKPLMAFSTNENNDNALPFGAQDYFELVEWTGRQQMQNKRGSIARDLPPLLERLALQTDHWLERSMGFEQWYRSCRKGGVEAIF